LRKRKNHTREEPSSKTNATESEVSPPVDHRASFNNSPKGWELIGECSNDKNLLLTASGESSDDFWKSDTQTKSSTTRQNSTKKKKEKTGVEVIHENRFRKIFQVGINSFKMLRSARSEWKSFKVDHRKEWKSLKQQYYECCIGLMLIFIFCGIGGIIFHSTEGAFEMFYKCGVKRVKRDFLDSLYSKRWLSEEEWKSLARSKLMEFENQLYDAYDAGMTSYSGQKGWSFINSFIYSMTVVTTIGE
jgi:hypothetical protein